MIRRSKGNTFLCLDFLLLVVVFILLNYYCYLLFVFFFEVSGDLNQQQQRILLKERIRWATRCRYSIKVNQWD